MRWYQVDDEVVLGGGGMRWYQVDDEVVPGG